MTITFKKNMALFGEGVTVEEAETLLQWLQTRPKAKLDLTQCTHLHTSNLQVMLGAKATVAAWPGDKNLKLWLQAAIKH